MGTLSFADGAAMEIEWMMLVTEPCTRRKRRSLPKVNIGKDSLPLIGLIVI
jgi:hypothetical protein